MITEYFFLQLALAFALRKSFLNKWKMFQQDVKYEKSELQTDVTSKKSMAEIMNEKKKTEQKEPEKQAEENSDVRFSKNKLLGFDALRHAIVSGELPSVNMTAISILSRSYRSSEDLIREFIIYVNHIENSQEKEIIEKRLQNENLKDCIRYAMEGRLDRRQVADARESLKNKDVRDFGGEIQNIFNENLDNIKNYTDLLGKAGCIYNAVFEHNKSLSLVEDIYKFDHVAVYKIAEYIIDCKYANDYRHFYFCRGLSKERLAKDITENILDYLDKMNKYISDDFALEGDYSSVKEFLCCHYLGGEIDTYYKFLNVCGKLHEELYRYRIRKGISKREEYDNRISMEMAEWILSNTDYSFLSDITQTQLAADITNNNLS